MNAIEATVSDWSGIAVEPHRFGGQEFTLENHEFTIEMHPGICAHQPNQCHLSNRTQQTQQRECR